MWVNKWLLKTPESISSEGESKKPILMNGLIQSASLATFHEYLLLSCKLFLAMKK